MDYNNKGLSSEEFLVSKEKTYVQPWVDHIKELRNRLAIVVVTFILIFITCFLVFPKGVISYMVNFAYEGYQLFAINPLSPFQMSIKLNFLFALLITTPVLLYNLWRFASPGFKNRERFLILIWLPVIIVLFILGCIFGSFVLFPFIREFIFSFNSDINLQQTYELGYSLDTFLTIVLATGWIFELPALVLFLGKLNLITSLQLRRSRRFSYLALVVIAAYLSPDVLVGNIIVIIPLIFLYEISILFLTWLEKRSV